MENIQSKIEGVVHGFTRSVRPLEYHRVYVNFVKELGDFFAAKQQAHHSFFDRVFFENLLYFKSQCITEATWLEESEIAT